MRTATIGQNTLFWLEQSTTDTSQKTKDQKTIERAVRANVDDLKFWWHSAQHHIQHNIQSNPILFLQAVQRLMVCLQLALLNSNLKGSADEYRYAYQYLAQYLKETEGLDPVYISEANLTTTLQLENALLDLPQSFSKRWDQDSEDYKESIIEDHPDFDLGQTCYDAAASMEYFLTFAGRYPHDKTHADFKVREANYTVALDFLEKRSTFYSGWKDSQSKLYKIFRPKQLREIDKLVKAYDGLSAKSNMHSLEEKQAIAQTIKLEAESWLLKHQSHGTVGLFHNTKQEKAVKQLITRIAVDGIRWKEQARIHNVREEANTPTYPGAAAAA